MHININNNVKDDSEKKMKAAVTAVTLCTNFRARNTSHVYWRSDVRMYSTSPTLRKTLRFPVSFVVYFLLS